MQALTGGTRIFHGRQQRRGLPDDVEAKTPRTSNFVDPWLAICDRCPLPDCVRPEGMIAPAGTGWTATIKLIVDCPIYQAHQRGWNAAEAMENKDVLGLLEDRCQSFGYRVLPARNIFMDSGAGNGAIQCTLEAGHTGKHCGPNDEEWI